MNNRHNTLFLIIFGILLIAGGFMYFRFNLHQTENKDVNTTGEEVANINAPDGWKVYTDEGLGFGFAYPADWELFPDPSSNEGKKRQEQMILQKGDIKVRIDPLGRRGAQSTGSPILEKKDITINGIRWRYFVITDLYYRFSNYDKSIVLKNDPDVNGIDSFGNVSTYRDEFRIHINIEKFDEQEKDKVIKTVSENLDTLKVI